MMHHAAAEFSVAPLVSWFQALIAPVFLGIISIMAVFHLFQREIMKFAEFILLAVAVAVVFYTPGIVHIVATAISDALGVH
jgi:hypothetical protein